jgi:hypothetical protein
VDSVQIVGVVLVLLGVGDWFLVARVARDHAPDNPRAQQRTGIGGVWSPRYRRLQLIRHRVFAGLFVLVGIFFAVTG